MFLPFTETAKKVLQIEDVPEEKIEVIYPGVDLERFKPGTKPEDLLAKNNIQLLFKCCLDPVFFCDRASHWE